MLRGLRRKLLMDGVQVLFRRIEENQLVGTLRGDGACEGRTDRATGTGDEGVFACMELGKMGKLDAISG